MPVKDIDIYWSTEGDFVLGNKGDFKSTVDVQSRTMIQKVLKRLMSSPGDWAVAPEIGVHWERILGKPNKSETGRLLEIMISSELTRGGFLSSSEFTVRVFPASLNQLGVLLNITPRDVRGETTLTFVYDMRDNRIIPRTV
jgi:hypothetical protein